MSRPKDKVREEFYRRCLTDTGYLARHVLGYNYDEGEDGTRANVGTGGIRADGPHAEMTEFLDGNQSGEIMMQAPRGTYKSTALVAYCTRRILANPNIRILYGMKTDAKAQTEKAQAIKHHLEHNVAIREHFGNLRGMPWAQKGFTVSTRTVPGIAEPTVSTFGVDKPATGGHYEVIILDDLVDFENVKNKEGIDKVLTALRMALSLMVPGGVLIVVGTRYADDDLYAYLEETGIKFLILDSGVEVYEDDLGMKKIRGTPRFAHQSIKYLTKKLSGPGADYETFMSQYMNTIVTGLKQSFRREHFRPCMLHSDLKDQLVGWIFTDTAVTAKEDNCHSVIAYVGFDQMRTAYLIDMRVGHWTPKEFEQNFFEIALRWCNEVTHAGELMETNAANYVYRSNLRDKARELKFKLNLVEIPRSGGELGKKQRIRSLQSRWDNQRFFVCHTVPKTYVDLTQVKDLWNPEGHFDADTNTKQPSGELVDQFVRHPKFPRNDIPDALADMDRTRPDGRYFAYWIPPHKRTRAKTYKAETRGDPVYIPGVFNKLPRQAPDDPLNKDWWSKLSAS